jgi:hypothetical protein
MDNTSTPSGKFWGCVRKKLCQYEAKYSPSRWFKDWGGFLTGREGIYVIVRLITVFVISVWMPTILKVSVASLAIIDVVLYHTAVVFVTQTVTDKLRNVFLTFISFFSLVISFSAFYITQSHCFEPSIENINQAIYFSFMTITTVGYGDIHPKSEAYLL